MGHFQNEFIQYQESDSHHRSSSIQERHELQLTCFIAQKVCLRRVNILHSIKLLNFSMHKVRTLVKKVV